MKKKGAKSHASKESRDLQAVVTPQAYEELVMENQALLSELELAYTNMEMILEESSKEKKIAYDELQKKFEALEELYNQLSKKENMLIHLEKLSSIGQFITELIHELRSPLTAISFHAQLGKMKDVAEDIKESFRVIENHVDGMSNLLDRFRAMAYKGKEDFQIFDLNGNLVKCIETIEIIKPKGMNIRLDLCDQKLMVKGDPYQITQIFLNIAKNAFDAMKDHGNELIVKTEKIHSEFARESEKIGCIHCQQNKEWNKILNRTSHLALAHFIDHGKGMPQELLKQVFEPFFTTKGRGEGTGLGLSICSDIALRHGGNLAIKSEEGKGCTFQFLIPLEVEQSK